MKKKMLIIFTGSMELGGIERSLLGLLDSIDYTEYDVDLFLYGHHGPLFNLINKNVHILPEVNELAYLRDSLKSKIEHGCFLAAILRVRDAILSRFHPVNFDKTWATIMKLCVASLETEYDLAISFFRPFDMLKQKVNARVKIGWIHTDYSSCNINISDLRDDYSDLDYIVAVSQECRQTFVEMFPEYTNTTIVIENILSASYIFEQSEIIDQDDLFWSDNKCMKLLSVGRYCEAKNFDNIPEICSLIRTSGLNVKWYIIGYGEDEEKIKEKIVQYNMEQFVILLGKRSNPYPYIKNCYLYVQPSKYEGKCVAVREAQLLNKPVVITDYPTSRSQLEDGYDGLIIPLDNKKCAQKLIQILNCPEKLTQISDNQSKCDYTNANEINKIYELLKK